MKNQILLALSLLLISSIGFSQDGSGSQETHSEWKEKTLYVYLYANSELYNNAVKNIAKERWINDKVEFLTNTKRNDKVYKEKKGVFLFAGGDFYTISGYKGRVNMYIQSNHALDWNLWYKSFKKDKEKVITESIVAWGNERLRHSSTERIELTLNALFNVVDNFKDGEYHYNQPKTENSIYNTSKNISTLKSGTLLIDEKSLPRTSRNQDLLNLNYIEQLYKGKFKIVTEKELAEAILKKEEGLNYLHVGESGSFQIFSIINISQQKIIFSGKSLAKPGESTSIKIYKRMLEDISTYIR